MGDQATRTGGEATEKLRLQTARVLCVVAALVYPFFVPASRAGGVVLEDPFELRWWVTGAIVAVLVGTFVSEAVRRQITLCLFGLVGIISLHAGALLIASDLHPLIVVMLFVVMTGFIATAAYTVTTTGQALLYLAAVATMSLVAVVLVDEPATNPFVFLLGVGTVSALAFVAVRAQLITLRRLVRSQGELQQDILRRGQVEQALRQSESHANALLHAVPDVMLRLRRDGAVDEVLNNQETELGEQLGRFVGRCLDDCVHGDPGVSVARAVEQALGSGRLTTVSLSCQSATEPLRSVEIRMAPTGAHEVLALVRDVTEDRAIEAKLRVTDRLAALGTLASGVAHEINNPLSYVEANLNYVQEQLQAAGPGGLGHKDRGEVLQALDEARDGGGRIRDIVAGLRERSRSSEDVIGPVDANEAIETAMRMLDNELKHRCRAEVHLEPVPYVVASPLRLVEIMLNLVTNALQALPDRSSDQNLVRVCSRSTGQGRVEIEVKDNGAGMSEALQGRIFDPFFSTKEPGVGTGLGLYLCHRFVTAFGGEIALQSAPGQGTTFTMVLRESPKEPRAASVHPSVKPAIVRILIVDDEPLVLRALSRMLRAYQVETASTAREGLAQCAQGHFDVVLCDMMMPELDGAEFHRALADAQPEMAARVVFMTGGAFTDRAQRFLATVSNRWVEKPVTRGRLLEAIEEQLERHPHAG